MTDHRHCHASGRFDVKRIAFARYVRRVVRRHDCDSFTTTESYANIVGLLRLVFGPKWIIVRSGEYVIGVRRSSYTRTKLSKYERLTSTYSGRDDWRNLFGFRGTFILRDDDEPVLFGSFHGPSKVQDGDGWGDPDDLQVKTAKTGYNRMGDSLHTARKRRPTLRVVVSGDTNQELRNDDMRREFESMLGLACNWSTRKPRSGTHDGRRGSVPTRCIDGTFSNVAMTDPLVAANVRRPPGLDHVAIVTGLDYGR